MIEVPYIYKMIKVFPPEEDEYISLAALQGRIWDSWMLPWLAHASKRNGSFVDVGANIGLDTVLFSCFGKVHAFEPVHCDILRENAFGCANPVITYDCALSDHEGTAEISLYPGKNAGAHSLVVKHEGGDSKQVQLKRLDDIIDEPVSFLKIDVEGHEMEVLEGARKIIEQYHPMMCVESFYHVKELEEFGKQYGYSMLQIVENNFILLKVQ